MTIVSGASGNLADWVQIDAPLSSKIVEAFGSDRNKGKKAFAGLDNNHYKAQLIHSASGGAESMVSRRLLRELCLRWQDAGIHAGDTVLIHSSLRRTMAQLAGYEPTAPQDILQSFLEAVGSKGTLLLPLFNFDFPMTADFDIRQTPSQMGALTEAARHHVDSVRTGHPIYSFAVLGRERDRFAFVDNFSGYGEDSPFGILRRMNGKIAVLDLPDQQSMTFYHYVEECCQVDYRYHKTFVGDYTDLSGYKSRKEYGLFVRKTELGVRTDVNAMGELLWSKGIYCGCRPGIGSGLRVARCQDIHEAVLNVIVSGKAKGLLYDIG